jgi:hypothetical protein
VRGFYSALFGNLRTTHLLECKKSWWVVFTFSTFIGTVALLFFFFFFFFLFVFFVLVGLSVNWDFEIFLKKFCFHCYRNLLCFYLILVFFSFFLSFLGLYLVFRS